MNAPVLPESAPFSIEQRNWLNGYLAGILNGAAMAGASAGLPSGIPGGSADASGPAVPAARVLVLYGSQSGNAEGLAHSAADKLKACLRQDGSPAFAPEVMGLDRFKEIDWSAEKAVLLATSTWGEGDMPDMAAPFWEWLKGPEAPSLAHLSFSVLGLGDRNYQKFCQAGKNVDKRLAELGASRLTPFFECDTDYESLAAQWMTDAVAALSAALPAPSASGEAAGRGDGRQNGANGNTHGTVNGTVNGSANGTANGVPHGAANGAVHAAPAATSVSGASSAAAAPAAGGAKSAFGKKNPFPAPLLENHPLNAKGSGKDTRHISLSLLGSGLTYKPGDALAVIPRNSYELVDRIIIALNCLGNEKVEVDGKETQILRSALLTTFDLRRATPRLLANLREDTRNPSDKRRLGGILAEEEKTRDYLEGKDVIDVLEDFSHTRLEAQRLVDSLGKLAPRLYSISSSPRENPGEVHLTVGIVRYRNQPESRIRRGVASTYLAERVPLGMPVQVYVQPTSHFCLPEKPGTPIIMVGPGTGIAPFRAFLQERRVLGDPGRNWVFFGDQRRQYDFLYSEEFVAWKESGFLTRLDLAFSRDQEAKVYVQDRMLESARELYAWLEEGAYFYVCGDAKRMA